MNQKTGLFARQQKLFSEDDDVEVLETEHCHDGFFKLDRLSLRHRKFDGGWSDTIVREVVHRKDAVGVLAYDPDLDAVCLIQQFRAPMLGRSETPWAFELIAGLKDKPGEAERDLVLREAQEEAGVTLDYLEKITSYWLSAGGSNERMSLYVGLTSLKEVGGVHGVETESEDILAMVVDREDAENWVLESGQSNATCIIALQWLKKERHRLQSIWQNGLNSN